MSKGQKKISCHLTLPENTCQIVSERLKNFPQEIVIVKPTFPESYPDWWIDE
jgi:hypothetical protein